VESEGDGVLANWTMRLLPIVLALAVSVGLLATLTHSPDHSATDQPSAAAVAVDRHHCAASAATVVGQSTLVGFGASLTAESADESGQHSNVASCLAALLVVIGGLLVGLRLLALPTSYWLARRQPPFRVRLGSISAVLCAPNAVRLSRLLI